MLSMTEAQLPPGFRFHPRDEELVCDYLANKVRGCKGGIMVDVDLNNCEPWDLPKVACVGGKEWYFFSQRDRKYATGQRTNRATRSGYWKATGKDRQVRSKGALVGMRKTLVFYQGRAPKGRKTDWVMHEFRMQMQGVQLGIHSLEQDWVLCRVLCKSSRDSGSALSRSSAMESTASCYDIDANSSPLPPLMDTLVAMEASSGGVEGSIIEAVPCFSGIFPPRSACPEDGAAPPFDIADHIMGGLEPELGCCDDDKVIKLVLKQLSKMDEGRSDRRELLADMAPPPQGNSESYPDHCLWNNTCSPNYSNNSFDGIQFVYNL